MSPAVDPPKLVREANRREALRASRWLLKHSDPFPYPLGDETITGNLFVDPRYVMRSTTIPVILKNNIDTMIRAKVDSGTIMTAAQKWLEAHPQYTRRYSGDFENIMMAVVHYLRENMTGSGKFRRGSTAARRHMAWVRSFRRK